MFFNDRLSIPEINFHLIKISKRKRRVSPFWENNLKFSGVSFTLRKIREFLWDFIEIKKYSFDNFALV